MKNDIVAIITARGGSKRIPKKNIKNFCGKPIIAYSIETAVKSDLFDDVIVSTDSIEIAKVSEKFGASIPFLRSEENSDDFSTTEDVLIEVINKLKAEGRKYKYICCIYPTAPFVNKNLLVEAIDKMEESEPAVVIPLVAFSYPPQRGFIIDDKGYARFKNPEYITTRSQDLEKLYHDAGQFYVYNVEKLISTKGIIENDYKAIIVPEKLVHDIDNEEDWEIAEMKYSVMKKKCE